MGNTAAYSEWHEVPGSRRTVAPGARVADPTPPDEMMEVTVRLKRKIALPGMPMPGRRMRRDEYAGKHGATADDLNHVRDFAAHFNLAIVAESAVERLVTLRGRAGDFQKAFQVELRTHRFDNGEHYRGRIGAVNVPSEIKEAVAGVFGLDNRIVAKRALRLRPTDEKDAAAGSTQTPGPTISFYGNQLAKIYNFPTGVDGTGQNIGIVELGGGYADADLKTYFQKAGIVQTPVYSARPVKGGATNSPPQPGDASDANIEVALDMEVLGTVAPGAAMFLYFCTQGTDQQILLAVSAAVHDEAADLSVISMSFGGQEYDAITMGTGPGAYESSQFQNNLDDVFQTAGHLGITVCVSSGDQGSAGWVGESPWDDKAHVEFPASSPNVLACGGTHIVTPTVGNPDEEVWHPATNVGTGGGISRFFKQPVYQQGIVEQNAVNPAGGLGRGVPDVCADAANESGYNVLCAGVWFNDAKPKPGPIGGTSAATPLWAGLIALINQSLGTRLGFINPLLYRIGSPSSSFYDVKKGTNGDYAAGAGWDACTGLGSPNGAQLLNALKPLLPNPMA